MNSQEKQQLEEMLKGKPQAAGVLSLLKENSTCNEDLIILKKAGTDIGLEYLVPYLLKSDPSWSQQALKYLPGLGEYEQPLIERAAELYKNIEWPAPELLAGELTTISELELYLDGAASYTAHFSMFWFTPPFVSPAYWQPAKGTPNSGSWVEGAKLDIYQSDTHKCSDFALATSPLQAGDTVVLMLIVTGFNRGWVNTGTFFTYDPASKNKARFDASGMLLSPTYSYTIIPST
jgi:hypothetical protein